MSLSVSGAMLQLFEKRKTQQIRFPKSDQSQENLSLQAFEPSLSVPEQTEVDEPENVDIVSNSKKDSRFSLTETNDKNLFEEEEEDENEQNENISNEEETREDEDEEKIKHKIQKQTVKDKRKYASDSPHQHNSPRADAEENIQQTESENEQEQDNQRRYTFQTPKNRFPHRGTPPEGASVSKLQGQRQTKTKNSNQGQKNTFSNTQILRWNGNKNSENFSSWDPLDPLSSSYSSFRPNKIQKNQDRDRNAQGKTKQVGQRKSSLASAPNAEVYISQKQITEALRALNAAEKQVQKIWHQTNQSKQSLKKKETTNQGKGDREDLKKTNFDPKKQTKPKFEVVEELEDEEIQNTQKSEHEFKNHKRLSFTCILLLFILFLVLTAICLSFYEYWKAKNHNQESENQNQNQNENVKKGVNEDAGIGDPKEKEVEHDEPEPELEPKLELSSHTVDTEKIEEDDIEREALVI